MYLEIMMTLFFVEFALIHVYMMYMCNKIKMLEVCKDQDLKQSDPKSSPQKQNGK